MNITDVSYNWGASGSMDGVSGASSYSPSGSDNDLSQARQSIQQDSQNFKSLRNALQSGDLAGAQSAYSTLQQQIQSASQSTGRNLFDSNSSIGKDFQAIGTALQSGDLAGAQQAFSTFRQDLRSAGHHHHHRGHAGSSASNDGTSNSSASSSTPASPAASGTSGASGGTGNAGASTAFGESITIVEFSMVSISSSTSSSTDSSPTTSSSAGNLLNALA